MNLSDREVIGLNDEDWSPELARLEQDVLELIKFRFKEVNLLSRENMMSFLEALIVFAYHGCELSEEGIKRRLVGVLTELTGRNQSGRVAGKINPEVSAA